MRKLFFATLLFCLNQGCKAQPKDSTVTLKDQENAEFSRNANGLIYSAQDINALRFVVDSLNLKFKTCDLNKKYYACPQGKVYSARFSSKTNDLKEIVKSLKSNCDPAILFSRHHNFLEETDSSELVVGFPPDEENKTTYLSGNAYSGFDRQYLLSRKKNINHNEWYYEYNKKDQYSDHYSISCVYIPQRLEQPVIPTEYAKLIQYVDCMVDTAATIYLNSETDDDIFSARQKTEPYYDELVNYINKKMKIKKDGEDDYSYNYLTDEKVKYATDSLKNDPFITQKMEQLNEWLTSNNGGNDETEELIATFVSKQRALELKRKRRVMGMCSQDQSPRIHARNIAMLAAETHSWDIFLRAHLDIMNDRFERASDGSYAWRNRLTYLQELEALDINVIDMMFGLCLRAYNVSDNHYQGTVWRIGKALCDSKDRGLFEEKAKKIMKDPSLDEFNRSLIFLLYHTYLNYLPDKTESKSKIETLKRTVSEYPGFLQVAISKMKTGQKN